MAETIEKKQKQHVMLSLRERAGEDPCFAREQGLDLVSSTHVTGTAVYRPNGTKIGRVDRVMIGKYSGQVQYVLISFGGFLGIGAELRPVPWEALVYSKDLGGFVVSAEDDVLKSSPYLEGNEEPNWSSAYGQYVFTHWGLAY